MFTVRILLAGSVALTMASLTVGDTFFTTLLKRQEPGTPAFNCHDNCGTAISVSKAGGDYCTDEVFQHDYENCLVCAGPEGFDIWKYYGASLAKAAEGCEGLETEPESGTKEVSEAMHIGDAPQNSTTTSLGESATVTGTGTAGPTAGPTASGESGTTNGTVPSASAPLTQPSNTAERVKVRNAVVLIGAVAAMGAFY
ncbi:hypothetical protein BU23DRAFT_36984 [Bimuria novae-zelandiae CBS 107.79]|uniref:Uncharacterized protein n=1 Tax=Bimuria novae-zelandiae CBS 107.79 TaxID=1447943 RepID=A0A6A5UK16_9PLEO|nr:hypothetical protein BU23DRAFT_36984 [Bimuria novae-zelandiae CBS 107.79]